MHSYTEGGLLHTHKWKELQFSSPSPEEPIPALFDKPRIPGSREGAILYCHNRRKNWAFLDREYPPIWKVLPFVSYIISWLLKKKSSFVGIELQDWLLLEPQALSILGKQALFNFLVQLLFPSRKGMKMGICAKTLGLRSDLMALLRSSGGGHRRRILCLVDLGSFPSTA